MHTNRPDLLDAETEIGAQLDNAQDEKHNMEEMRDYCGNGEC